MAKDECKKDSLNSRKKDDKMKLFKYQKIKD